MSSSKQSSYSAFSEVDALVSKPVLGSDGAAKWQDFKTNNTSIQSRNTAPSLPMKRVDKLATGFQTIEQERRNEELIRKEAGENVMGVGYSSFKRKGVEDHEAKKRRKMVLERVRPDEKKYFIPAQTFEGWKEDYAFTTKGRGTGYYWDGMDSVKALDNNSTDNDGEKTTTEIEKQSEEAPGTAPTSTPMAIPEIKPKKKKKKKSKATDSSLLNDNSSVNLDNIDMSTLSPMEQVQMAMMRRNQIASQPPAFMTKATNNADTAALQSNISSTNTISQPAVSSEPIQISWEKATDPSSGKIYYFNRTTGERQWNEPTEAQGTIINDTQTILPHGWQSATAENGKVYYYHSASGKTSWELPTE